ncbi:pimeloyl-ACP methyl ester carboxylesterase [Rhizobium sp. BK251]|nr:pimeloyl-ACP methyl ester carboxylesterase [Rhizobium sp. BK251]
MKSVALEAEKATIRFHDLPGHGPPLILIHGLGCASSCDYPAVAADPALSGRNMLLIDLLGSGFSDRPTEFRYSVELHARTIVKLVHRLGIESLDFFGHSMGGAIAIVAASLMRDRVRHIILAEPNIEPGGGIFSRRIAAMSEADYVDHGHDDLVRLSRSEGNEIWAASLSVSAPYAMHRAATSLVLGSDPTWCHQLDILEVSKTAIYGRASLPDARADKLKGLGVDIEVVEDAGHLMACDNPSGLARAISAALS